MLKNTPGSEISTTGGPREGVAARQALLGNELVPPQGIENQVAVEQGHRFAIREGGRTVGTGVVAKIHEDRKIEDISPKTPDDVDLPLLTADQIFVFRTIEEFLKEQQRQRHALTKEEIARLTLLTPEQKAAFRSIEEFCKRQNQSGTQKNDSSKVGENTQFRIDSATPIKLINDLNAVSMVPGGVGTIKVNFSPGVGEPPKTLTDAQNEGSVQVDLTGDGANTLEQDLCITNVSPKDVVVKIGDWIFFNPVNSPGRQSLLKLPGTLVQIPNGMTITRKIPTLCASTKLEKPPGPKEEGVDYKIGPHKNSAVGASIIQIAKTAQQLDNRDAFKTVPINQVLRWKKIAQTAIWKYTGDLTQKKEDDITRQTMRDELVAGLNTTYEKLPSEKQKKVDDMVDAIYGAVMRVLKAAAQY
ncbi:MAG: hypothetical protein K8F91_15425 [Candidatus Obscuribacterales bacterium]|nr:hypothetical protein [Candidatus Obscuribacterales bacterium]